MTIIQTASGLWRDANCPPNRALPRIHVDHSAAKGGRAKHRFLEVVPKVGTDKALEEIADEYREACALIELDGLPLGQEYLQEAAFSLDGDIGSFLGCGLNRNYGGAALAGTADVVHKERAEVWDYKMDGFDSTCPPPRENAQLLFLALAVCRARGLDDARVGLVHIRPDGSHWAESADLDAFDLDAFALELQAIRARVVQACEAVARGLTPEVFQGPWCHFCAAMPACPAILGTIRAAAAEPEQALVLAPEGVQLAAAPADVARALTPEIASRAYARMRAVEQALNMAKSALYLYASEHGIGLGNGYQYRGKVVESKNIDARVARQEMARLFGPEVAENACEFDTSQAAIERAIRPLVAAGKKPDDDGAFKVGTMSFDKKPTLKLVKEQTLAAIEKAGGLKRDTRVRVAEYRADE